MREGVGKTAGNPPAHCKERQAGDGRLSAGCVEVVDVIRRRYQVYGRVQGVGFRYTVVQAANALGLTGWGARHPGDVGPARTVGVPDGARF